MSFLNIISIFVVLANLSLGFFVWWKGKKKKANIWFFILTLAVAGWVFCNWVSNTFKGDFGVILTVGRLTYFFAASVVFIFIYFVIYFPYKINLNRKFHIALILTGVVFLLLSNTGYVLRDSIIRAHSNFNVIVVGDLYWLYSVYILAFFVIGFSVLVFRIKHSRGIERQKISYVLVGYIVPAAIGVFTNLFWAFFVEQTRTQSLSSYGPLFTIVMVASISYGILRHRLMDIKVVIRKGVVHFVSIAIVLFLYIYLLFFTQQTLIDQYRLNERTSLIIMILVIALTIEPLRRFLFKVVDKVFYSQRKNAKEEAKKLRFILSSSLQFDQLIRKVKTELQSFLDVQSAQFLWNNKQNGNLENYYKDETIVSFGPTDPLFHYLQMYPDVLVIEELPYMIEEAINGEKEILAKIHETLLKLNVGLVCPIGEKGELVGAFFFGPKEKKEAFTSDNVEYLSTLQAQLTGAIMNALLYKQAVERITHSKI